jgi:light-independent protochlorophyllide reductase subunit B
VLEITRLLASLGVDVNVVAPLGASVDDLRRLPLADFNVLLYPEVGHSVADWLQRQHGMPCVRTIPIGWRATDQFVREVCELAGVPLPDRSASRARWWSESVDAHYLTGKRVFVFGDATHAIAAAQVAAHEMGFEVVGLGSYSREFAREVRAQAQALGLQALITDNYHEVQTQIQALQPELILGTQMERHIAKRLGIPCAVISSPVHVQDFPARHSPQMGDEGANVLFDTWIHPLMMGLEEHLLGMFREDFEFHGDASPSHLGHGHTAPPGITVDTQSPSTDNHWTTEAEAELRKIPFFVRGKAKRNTERYASELGLSPITVETLYDAKAHFSR